MPENGVLIRRSDEIDEMIRSDDVATRLRGAFWLWARAVLGGMAFGFLVVGTILALAVIFGV